MERSRLLGEDVFIWILNDGKYSVGRKEEKGILGKVNIPCKTILIASNILIRKLRKVESDWNIERNRCRRKEDVFMFY